jgi:hypothetical protein
MVARTKSGTDPQILDALGCLFATGHDFFGDAAAVGIDAETEAQKRALWKRYGRDWLRTFDPVTYDVRPGPDGLCLPEFLRIYGKP